MGHQPKSSWKMVSNWSRCLFTCSMKMWRNNWRSLPTKSINGTAFCWTNLMRWSVPSVRIECVEYIPLLWATAAWNGRLSRASPWNSGTNNRHVQLADRTDSE